MLGARIRQFPDAAGGADGTPAARPAAARPAAAAASAAGASQASPFPQKAFAPVTGTSFAVWAPNARGVRVIGDFNFWDGHAHPMRSLGSSGVWELFVPGAGEGTRYKFEICGPDGSWHRKADPMARARARAAGHRIGGVSSPEYQWGDSDWMAARDGRNPLRQPMSVYEVHIGSWRPGLSYAELADALMKYVHRPRLHPRRVPAGGRAPVRRVLGIPGDVVLRAVGAVRHAG